MALTQQQKLSPLKEFEAARKRLKSTFSADKERLRDAIKQRAAALGGGPGRGAFQKIENQGLGQIARAEATGFAELESQEAQERQRRQEVKEQREFLTSERQAQQDFQRKMFDAQLDFERKRQEFGEEFALKEFGERKRQFELEYAENVKNNQIANIINFFGDDPRRVLDEGQVSNAISSIEKIAGSRLSPSTLNPLPNDNQQSSGNDFIVNQSPSPAPTPVPETLPEGAVSMEAFKADMLRQGISSMDDISLGGGEFILPSSDGYRYRLDPTGRFWIRVGRV